MNPALLGLFRGLGFAVLMAVLSYLGNAANLSGVVDTSLAAVISSIVLAIEHSLASKGDTALFGAVRTRK